MSRATSGKLRVALIQTDTIWLEIDQNLARLDQWLDKISKPIDLILLSEMFATGYTLKPEVLDPEKHSLVVDWMKKVASGYNCAIAGSHPFPEKGNFYNRLFFCHPDGHIDYYDKRHLFPMEGENLIYRRGNKRKIVEFNSWTILPLICYDLRFPVWSRNKGDFDILFYSSNWPAARNSTWEILLKARAIENQCYVVGINRTGTDGNTIRYSGNSQIISPTGEVLGKLEAEAGILSIELDKKMLTKYRKQFQVLNDRDDFEIRM